MTDDTRAPERIELPGGWCFKHGYTDKFCSLRNPEGDHPPIPWTWEEARAFASTMSTSAFRLPSREKIARAIALEIQFKDFGNTDPTSEEWVCTVEQINLLQEASERAADAVLALFSVSAQAA